MSEKKPTYRVTDPFVLHMFLERYTSDYVGNDPVVAMERFSTSLDFVNQKKLREPLENGIAILNNIKGIHHINLDTYEEFAEMTLKQGGSFIIPGGYKVETSGHMVAILFEAAEEKEGHAKTYTVTYCNSGSGINYKRYHRVAPHSGLFEVCVTTKDKKAGDLKLPLAHLLYQHCPMPGNYNNIRFKMFRNFAQFYDAVLPETIFSPRPELKKEDMMEVLNKGTPNIQKALFKRPRQFLAGVNNKAGIFAAPQVTGTCTFHSVMWVLFYLMRNRLNYANTQIEEVEEKMRDHVISCIDHVPETSEEATCLRLLECDVPHIVPTIRSTAIPHVNKSIRIENLPSNMHPNHMYLVAAKNNLANAQNDPRRLRVGIDSLLTDLRTLLRENPSGDTSMLLNLAQSAILHAMESIVNNSSIAFVDDIQRANYAMDLAEAALLPFPLFEGKDRVRMSSDEPSWTRAYHRRYRRAVFRLALLVIEINESFPSPSSRLIGCTDRSKKLRKSHLYDEARSAEESARILPYAVYAWPLRASGGAFDDFDSKQYDGGGMPRGRGKPMWKVLNEHSSVAHANLKRLVETHPIGYAMTILLTLLCTRRKNEGGHAAYWQIYLPSIRADMLVLRDGNEIGIDMYDIKHVAELVVLAEDYYVPHAKLSSVQASLADADAILQSQHANRVITTSSDVQLESLLAASFERPGFFSDMDGKVGQTQHLNFNTVSVEHWNETYRKPVLDKMYQSFSDMNDSALVYFLVLLTSGPDVYVPRSRSRSLAKVASSRLESEHNRLGLAWAACALALALALALNDRDIPKDLETGLFEFVCDHQGRALHFYGDSKVLLQGVPYVHSDRRVYVLCRLIIDWSTEHEGMRCWSEWSNLILPKQFREWIHQKVDQESLVVQLCPLYDMPRPKWIVPTYQGDRTLPKYPISGGFEVHHDRGNGDTVTVCSSHTQDQWLVGDCSGHPEIRTMVRNLANGGFKCSVWYNTTVTTIEFADSRGRSGSLARYHSFSQQKSSDDKVYISMDGTSRWKLTWGGQNFTVTDPAAVPGPMRMWGPPYVGATAFWINPHHQLELLVLTSGAVSIPLFASVFNKDPERLSAEYSEGLTDRTMRVRMHPCGRHPELAEDTAPLLFALCQASSKDQCLARLLWYVSSMPKEAKSKLLNDLCAAPKLLSHPFRHVLDVVYTGHGTATVSRAVKMREATKQLDKVSPFAEYVGDCADSKNEALMYVNDRNNKYESMASARIVYGENGIAICPSTPVELTQNIIEFEGRLDSTWRSIHRFDTPSVKQHRLFVGNCSSYYTKFAMWGGMLNQALRQTTGWGDVGLLDTVLGRVHPKLVPTPFEKGPSLPYQDDFQLAQGVLVNRAQIELLNKMWPDSREPPQKKAVYQAVMGIGKSRVLMPYLVFRGLRCTRVDRIIVVQPEHLVADAVRMVRRLLGSTGGFYGRKKTDVARLVELERMSAKNIFKAVCVVSDTALKEYLLASYVKHGEAKSGRGIPYENTLMIYDEIDDMYSPLKSEYNLPTDEKCFHPMETKGIHPQVGSVGFSTWYGQVVVKTVRGHLDGNVEGNALLRKLQTDYASISANFGLNYQFGRASDPSILLAVPFKAAQTPVDRSSFSDIDITALLTAHMVVHEGLLERDFELLKRELHGSWEMQFAGIPRNLLDDLFKITVTGVDAPYSLSGILDGSGGFNEIRTHAPLIDYYVGRILLPKKLAFHPTRSNISFIDAMNVSQFAIGFSGTINMKLPEVGDNPINNLVVSPDAALSIDRCIKMAEIIFECPPDTDMATFAIYILASPKNHYSVLIDACAVWKDFLPPQVHDALKDMSVVGKDDRFVWFGGDDRPMEKVGNTVRLHDPTAPAGVQKTFYYFDQKHCRGTDLNMPGNARALVTVDMAHSTLTDIAQAAFRMRRIFKGQKVDYVVKVCRAAQVIEIKDGDKKDGEVEDGDMEEDGEVEDGDMEEDGEVEDGDMEEDGEVVDCDMKDEDGEKIAVGVKLLKMLKANEKRDRDRSINMHAIQAYKAERRWLVNKGSESDIKGEYQEATPYPLLNQKLIRYGPTTGSKLLHLHKEAVKAAKCLGELNSSARVVQTHTQVQRQVSQQRQAVDAPNPSRCFPEFKIQTYNNLSMANSTSELHGAAERIGLAFSPLAFQVPSAGRRYMLISGQVLIVTLGESLLLTKEDYSNVYGAAGGGGRGEKSTFLHLLGRLLCGANLDIQEQLSLLVSLPNPQPPQVPPPIADLYTVIRCLWKLGLIHLTVDQILHTLASMGHSPSNAAQLLEGFYDTNLQSDRDIYRYMFRDDMVVNFLTVDEQKLSGDEQNVRGRVIAGLNPVLKKTRALFAEAIDNEKKKEQKSPEQAVINALPEDIRSNGLKIGILALDETSEDRKDKWTNVTMPPTVNLLTVYSVVDDGDIKKRRRVSTSDSSGDPGQNSWIPPQVQDSTNLFVVYFAPGTPTSNRQSILQQLANTKNIQKLLVYSEQNQTKTNMERLFINLLSPTIEHDYIGKYAVYTAPTQSSGREGFRTCRRCHRGKR